eukprot:4765644-Prymnesium_polylepis.1
MWHAPARLGRIAAAAARRRRPAFAASSSACDRRPSLTPTPSEARATWARDHVASRGVVWRHVGSCGVTWGR